MAYGAADPKSSFPPETIIVRIPHDKGEMCYRRLVPMPKCVICGHNMIIETSYRIVIFLCLHCHFEYEANKFFFRSR